MKAANFSSRSKRKSLAAKIKDAERQVFNRRQGISVRTAMLVRQIHRQMTAPASLLLAGGIGFITGELTRHHPPKAQAITAGTPRTAKATPLRAALNLIGTAQTLYTAVLPLLGMAKSFQQRAAQSAPPQERRPIPAAASCAATVNAKGCEKAMREQQFSETPYL